MTNSATEGRWGMPLAREIDAFGAVAPTSHAFERPPSEHPAVAVRHAAVTGGRAFLRRSIRDWMLGTVGGGAFAPSNVLGSIAQMLVSPRDLVRLAVPGPSSRTAWTEFRNKLAVFRLFADADSVAGMGTWHTYRLSDLMPAVQTLAPFPRLWVTEGIGYYHAASALEINPAAREILSPAAIQGVPSRWLIPLHTGVGLALAGNHLRTISGRGPRADTRRVIKSFLAQCRENALEGYAGTCVEALGLMTLNVRPDLVPAIDRELTPLGSDFADRFWHGYGRALYFSPANVLPCTSLVWPSIRRAVREPPRRSGRSNALAGLAWALTLVNIRDPDVIAMFMARHGGDIPEIDAFANGVRSAVTVWVDWDPGSDYLRSFCAYDPPGASGMLGDRWAEVARGSCGEEFMREYHRMKSHNRLDDLFRYLTVSGSESRSS
jgi:hypothetical protein